MAESIVNPHQVESQDLKRCTKCKAEQSIYNFTKDSHKKDGLRSWCKSCTAEAHKLYFNKHREERHAYAKQYRIKHTEELAQRQRDHYSRNKAKIHARHKKYRNKNKYKIALYHKRYSKENKDKIATKAKQYAQTEQGKYVARNTYYKRKAAKYNVDYEVFDQKEVFERDGYICQHCRRKTRPDFKNQYHPLYPNLDHIVPISKGGPHTRLNTQCLCYKCNLEKGNTKKRDQLRMFG